MVIQEDGKNHRVAAWQLQAVRLKIRDSHLTCKVVNKGPNVRGWVEAVERNVDGPLPCLVNRQYLKENPDRKKVMPGNVPDRTRICWYKPLNKKDKH